jgi:alpha-beta hydrolase superfamily lysophospholipase
MGKGVQEAHDKFIEAGMEDVEIKLYPNDRHEILNELDRETVYNDIYQWMLSKMV